eukprot:scaffold63425_cov60-Phaeocystis_antarctica.AAC.1
MSWHRFMTGLGRATAARGALSSTCRGAWSRGCTSRCRGECETRERADTRAPKVPELPVRYTQATATVLLRTEKGRIRGVKDAERVGVREKGAKGRLRRFASEREWAKRLVSGRGGRRRRRYEGFCRRLRVQPAVEAFYPSVEDEAVPEHRRVGRVHGARHAHPKEDALVVRSDEARRCTRLPSRSYAAACSREAGPSIRATTRAASSPLSKVRCFPDRHGRFLPWLSTYVGTPVRGGPCVTCKKPVAWLERTSARPSASTAAVTSASDIGAGRASAASFRAASLPILRLYASAASCAVLKYPIDRP